MFQNCPLSADWGDVATWFGAVSTFAAALAVIAIARRDARSREAETASRKVAKAASYAALLTNVNLLCEAAIAEKEKYQEARSGQPPTEYVAFMARKWTALDVSPLRPGGEFSPLDVGFIFRLTEIGNILERMQHRISEGLQHPGMRIGIGHVMVAAGEELLPKVKALLESIREITKPGIPKH